ALELVACGQRFHHAAFTAGVEAVLRHLAIARAELLGQYGKAGADLVVRVEVQAEIAIDLENAQAHLAEMLDAELAQLHEELVAGNVLLADGRKVVAAVADDRHRAALGPAAQRRAVLHQPGGDPGGQQQNDEYPTPAQHGYVVIEGDVAGRRAQGEDHHYLEQRQLADAAATGELEEDEYQQVGEDHAQRDFTEKTQRQLIEQQPVPFEGFHGRVPCGLEGPYPSR